MEKFEVGKSYTHGWIGDSELFTTWEVIARTARTITIKNGREIHKRRIIKYYEERDGIEAIYPLGEYSMCPVLRATNDY